MASHSSKTLVISSGSDASCSISPNSQHAGHSKKQALAIERSTIESAPLRRHLGPMPQYWIVLKPEREELYQRLLEVLRGSRDVTVIRDRRSGSSPDGGRRTALVWQGNGLLIAERGKEGEEQL